MANEQTSVPLYASSEILTAANMNISAGTGVPVFATTVTRDAAFGGANEKVLAEGQLCYLSASNIVQYYDGAAWATVGPAAAAASGLTLVSASTIGTTVSSVTVSSAFSATYDNYKIIVNGGTSSASPYLKMTLGATATGYYFGELYRTYGGVSSADNLSNGSYWLVGSGRTNGLISNIEIQNPFLSARTSYTGNNGNLLTTGEVSFVGGFLDNATSYTAFTLTPNTGTITGGTIRVYGYANS